MSKSRQKRKRDRRRFLAGAGDRDVHPFQFGGVLGTGPAHPGRANLRFIFRAINQDWPMPPDKRAALIAHLSAILRQVPANHRNNLAAARCILAADRANLRAFKAALELIYERNAP